MSLLRKSPKQKNSVQFYVHTSIILQILNVWILSTQNTKKNFDVNSQTVQNIYYYHIYYMSNTTDDCSPRNPSHLFTYCRPTYGLQKRPSDLVYFPGFAQFLRCSAIFAHPWPLLDTNFNCCELWLLDYCCTMQGRPQSTQGGVKALRCVSNSTQLNEYQRTQV